MSRTGGLARRAALIAGVALLLVTWAGGGRAEAAFKVYPTSVELVRAPGGAALGTVNVKLNGEGGQRFRAVIEDVGQRPDGTEVYTPASGRRFSAAAWIAVSPRAFGGAPDRVQPLQFRVAVPRDAEPGDHLASLTVQRLGGKRGGGSAGATAAAIEAISVNLTIRVSGVRHPAARITSLQVPSLANGGPVSIAATVRNTGNVTLDFEGANRGAITVLDGGRRRAQLPSFPGQLFPGQSREFVEHWDDPPLFGSFEAEASVRTGGRDARRSAGFLVLPWREIGALLLVVVAAVIFAFGWRRRRWGY